jgi:hypothetical protein
MNLRRDAAVDDAQGGEWWCAAISAALAESIQPRTAVWRSEGGKNGGR